MDFYGVCRLHSSERKSYFHLRDQPNVRLSHNGLVITFWYEKMFKVGPNAWVLPHCPDFTAMLDNVVLAVFDAKNYTGTSRITDSKNKMLAYMANLGSPFGALIYPNHPKHWDEYDNSDRLERLEREIPRISNSQFADEAEVGKMAKEMAKLDWHDLPDVYREFFTPKNAEIFENVSSKKVPKQKLCLFRMSPTTSEFALSMARSTLDSIYEAIVSNSVLLQFSVSESTR